MSAANAGMLLVFGFLLLITAIVITSLFAWASTVKAKASAAREANYRELAEKASMDSAEIKASLIEVKSRLASVERMLKEVE
jgi:ABC-type dipeptide/oligopeptide/nickel transport system permease subunit